MHDVPRAVQVIPIQLNQAEYFALIDYFHANEGKAYKNVTHVNDCSTMAMKALRKTTSLHVPKMLDASPFATETALQVFRLVDQKKVSSTMLVIEENLRSESPDSQFLFRNLIINYLDVRIAVAGAILNLPYRAWIEGAYSEEMLQYWDSETIDYFKQIQIREESQIRSDPQVEQFFKLARRSKEFAVDKKRLKSIVMMYFDQKLKSADELSKDASSDITTRYVTAYRIKAYEEIKNELLLVIEGVK